MFLNTSGEVESNGMYGVNLFTLGVPHTVVVDDYLPLHPVRDADGKVEYETLFTHVSDD